MPAQNAGAPFRFARSSATADYIKRLVDNPPPLSDAQKALVRGAFRQVHR